MIELNYAEIYKEYKNGASIRKLANKYNCAATTLSNRLKEYCRENEIEFLTKKTKLELPMQDIYNMYCYEDKTSTELAKMFNCVPETIISRLRIFAKKENLPLNIREGHRRKKNLPIEQIYNEYIAGISSKKLGQKYGCMHNVILNRLREYANEHNLELVIREAGPILFKLPNEEIYKKYISGMSLCEIGEDYGCSDRCIKKRLVDYCKENDIELTMREAARRKIKLPIDEIYKNINPEYPQLC